MISPLVSIKQVKSTTQQQTCSMMRAQNVQNVYSKQSINQTCMILFRRANKHTHSYAERRKKIMRTVCKSVYNNGAMPFQCTHAQRNERKVDSNRSQETITIWSIIKGSVSRPSDVQWVNVVQCTEPREVVLNGKLQNSRQCLIIRAPLIWPIIYSHRLPETKFLDRNWQTLAGISRHYAQKIKSEIPLLVPPELVRTNTQLQNLNIVNTRYIFNSSVTVQTHETK